MTVVDLRRAGSRAVARAVSILVLVDDGRRLRLVASQDASSAVFQSLFLWMTVVDLQSLRIPAALKHVSILVLVDDGRRLQPGLRCQRDRLGFNPCSCG